MGVIISKFRKKPSTLDILTKLDEEIHSIEEFQKRTSQTRRRIVFQFVILALIFYILLAGFGYFFFLQISQNHQVILSIHLLALPLIIWEGKEILSWYYNKKIERNEKKLIGLKDEMKKILENVKETETYKVAKEILDRFGTGMKALSPITTPKIRNSQSCTNFPSAYDTGAKRMLIPSKSVTPFNAPSIPPSSSLELSRLSIQRPNTFATPFIRYPPSSAQHLPRSILPRNRTVLDKMVDYLIGDGPSNRFALICKNCNGHNGMALREEFEYLSFKCCYCSHFNPARKMKPVGPKFEKPSTTDIPRIKAKPKNLNPFESSDSEKSSKNDSDDEIDEVKPLIEETRNNDSSDTAKSSDFEKISENDVSLMEVEEESINNKHEDVIENSASK